MMRLTCVLSIAATIVSLQSPTPPTRSTSPRSPQDFADDAESAFEAGRIEDSLAAFDRLTALVPGIAPALWQRGIALYELGRFDECAAQFLAYHAGNPSDLESVAWHFFCVARAKSPAAARAALLTGGPDPRVLRGEIYQMVSGRMSPAELLALADTSVGIVQFYAHLYVGFYLDATGDRASAREHLIAAASEPYRDFGGFMNTVARVHVARLAKSSSRGAAERPGHSAARTAQ